MLIALIFRLCTLFGFVIGMACVAMVMLGESHPTRRIVAQVYSVIQDRQRMALIDVNRNLPVRLDFPIATSNTAFRSLSHDGKQVIVQIGGTFYVWDILGGQVVSPPSVFDDCVVQSLQWLRDNRHVVFECRNNAQNSAIEGVYTFDTQTAQVYPIFITIPPITKMQWSPDSQHVAIVDVNNGRIYLIDIHGTKTITISPQGRRFTSVAWMPDSLSLLAVGNTTLERYTLETETWDVVVNDFATVQDATFFPQISPDGAWVTLISNERLRRAHNFNIATGERFILETQQIRLNNIIRLIWSPNSQWVIVSTPLRSQDDVYYLVRPDASAVIPFGEGFGNTPQWSPDGGKISYETSHNAGRQLYIWDVNSFLSPQPIISNAENVVWSAEGDSLLFIYNITERENNQRRIGFYRPQDGVRFLTQIAERASIFAFLP